MAWSLLSGRQLGSRGRSGYGAFLLAIGAWYSPLPRPGREAARIEDGVRIETLWLLTAPIDQVLFPRPSGSTARHSSRGSSGSHSCSQRLRHGIEPTQRDEADCFWS